MSTNPPFKNVRDAFCHQFRCAPRDFDRKFFFRTLQPFRAPLALPIWWFNRNLFAVDLDVIQTIGKSARREDCEGILEEFHNANRIERGFRRGVLGIRISGTRVIELRDLLDPLIEPPEVVNPLASVRLPAGTSALAPRGASVVTLRKLREMHSTITQGASLAKLLSEAQLTEDQFLEQLESNGAGHPGFLWLREQMLRDRRLREAEQQVAALNQVLAAQSRELEELRPLRGKPA
jgi:hypothetical protein